MDAPLFVLLQVVYFNFNVEIRISKPLMRWSDADWLADWRAVGRSVVAAFLRLELTGGGATKGSVVPLPHSYGPITCFED